MVGDGRWGTAAHGTAGRRQGAAGTIPAARGQTQVGLWKMGRGLSVKLLNFVGKWRVCRETPGGCRPLECRPGPVLRLKAGGFCPFLSWDAGMLFALTVKASAPRATRQRALGFRPKRSEREATRAPARRRPSDDEH